VSAQSVTSSFVAEEERTALEARGRGNIKDCLIFALDSTTYRALPEWLREINVVQSITSPKACARKIQARLAEIDAQSASAVDLYLGRDDDEKSLRSALANPPKLTPVFLHAVGHPGIGRKTFVRNVLSKVYPRLFEVFVDITVGPFDAADEVYRKLYQVNYTSGLDQTIRDFMEFKTKDEDDKIEEISVIINGMSESGEFLLLSDDGGIFTDEGDYQPVFQRLLQRLSSSGQPLLACIQTRMMPLSRRQKYPKSYHTFLRPLADETVRELLSLGMKERGIDFEQDDVRQMAELLDGHPYNVKFALIYAAEYGVSSVLRDPSELIEWKRQRAEDFLAKLIFTDQQADIMAALSEYRYIAAEMMFAVIDADSSKVARDLRRLEEFCCIERRQGFYHISAPVREAVRRDERFERSDTWKQRIGVAICEALRDYEGDDFVSVEIIESGTVAAAKGAKAPAFLTNLILPSHLLRIARDAYDKRQWKVCAEFCKRAWESRKFLPRDAQVELLRLYGLSAARLDDRQTYETALSELRNINTRVAQRVRFFLTGFFHRLKGEMDEAEDHFIRAHKLAPENASVNRELASLYCKQRRYVDAESHARAAYEKSPTNPFLIDIYAEALLGKTYLGLPVDQRALDVVLRDLRKYGDAPGSSFFLIRDAQQKFRSKDYQGALQALDKAIERTPALSTPYFIRADVRLAMGDIPGAERDLADINKLLTQVGGFSREDEAQAHDLEIRILIAKSQFDLAKNKIERSAFLARRVANRLLETLARAIGFDPRAASPAMQKWAKAFDINSTRRK
jgi:tetratricopeptide (TPR) repeat protein